MIQYINIIVLRNKNFISQQVSDYQPLKNPPRGRGRFKGPTNKRRGPPKKKKGGFFSGW
jgi:hypothetical protein